MTGLPAGLKAKTRKRDRFPPMRLLNVNSGQRLSVRVYDRRGHVYKPDLKKLRHFLRCRRTGRTHPIAWRLVKNLYRVSRAFPGRTIRVYSGFRHRSIAKLKTSNHTRGRAIDFGIRGVSNRRLRDYLRKRFARVGVGYYPNSLFVHFDVRPKQSAFWVDLSRPGRRARYTDAYAVLKAERLKSKRRSLMAKRTTITHSGRARKTDTSRRGPRELALAELIARRLSGRRATDRNN